MNHSLPPLPRTIELLRDVARAPSMNWPAFVREVAELPKVTIPEAGAAAALLAWQVAAIVKQTVQVVPEAESAMRMLLTHLADVLQFELNARGQKAHWADKD